MEQRHTRVRQRDLTPLPLVSHTTCCTCAAGARLYDLLYLCSSSGTLDESSATLVACHSVTHTLQIDAHALAVWRCSSLDDMQHEQRHTRREQRHTSKACQQRHSRLQERHTSRLRQRHTHLTSGALRPLGLHLLGGLGSNRTCFSCCGP